MSRLAPCLTKPDPKPTPCSRLSTRSRDDPGHRRPGSTMAHLKTHLLPLRSTREYILHWPDGENDRKQAAQYVSRHTAGMYPTTTGNATAICLARHSTAAAVSPAPTAMPLWIAATAVSHAPNSEPLWPAAMAVRLAPAVTPVWLMPRPTGIPTAVSDTPPQRRTRHGENPTPTGHHQGSSSLGPRH